MKITIVYDNKVFRTGLHSDWGFSCLVEAHNRKILFDTGTRGSILLGNMRKLKIDPLSIDDVFISHPHFDHIGGLPDFLNKNNDVRVYVPVSLSGIHNAREIISIDEPVTLYDKIYSTGELEHIEQSMVVETEKGLVVVTGCSHPRMKNILEAASQFGNLYAIVGGFHGFAEFELFRNLEVICPTHCTQHMKEIRSMFPDEYIEGGAGQIIEI